MLELAPDCVILFGGSEENCQEMSDERLFGKLELFKSEIRMPSIPYTSSSTPSASSESKKQRSGIAEAVTANVLE